MKNNKSGVSLMILMITMMIMAILAGATLTYIGDNGVLSKSASVVEDVNLYQIQEMANSIWIQTYTDKTTELSANHIISELKKRGVNTDEYKVILKNDGVIVKKGYNGPTLGSLITSAEMYGTKVNYEANGVTDWKVFYKQTVNDEEYVYLIASEKLEYDKVPQKFKTDSGVQVIQGTVTLGADNTRTVGQIYWDTPPESVTEIQNPALWMAEWSNYTSKVNGICSTYFLNENMWSAFKNTTSSYKEYVKGAIGTPTAEMFVASWNEKREATGNTKIYNIKLGLSPHDTFGYYVNDITDEEAPSIDTYQEISNDDLLYIWTASSSNSAVWLASPSGFGSNYIMLVYSMGTASYNDYAYVEYGKHNLTNTGVRPVVCMSADTPAKLTENGLDINI